MLLQRGSQVIRGALDNFADAGTKGVSGPAIRTSRDVDTVKELRIPAPTHPKDIRTTLSGYHYCQVTFDDGVTTDLASSILANTVLTTSRNGNESIGARIGWYAWLLGCMRCAS
jgi:hypothetical protein